MDKNLQYAILDSLKQIGQFNFNIEEFYEKMFNKKYNYDASYTWKPFKPVEDYFQSIDLNILELSKLEQLTWSPYSDLTIDIWNHYDGEDDYFDICSLDGIEICPNIKRILVESVWSVKDLKPLANLHNLEIIQIYAYIEAESLTPLLSLERLQKIDFDGISFKDKQESENVVNILKSKGVDITVKYMI